jgi:hypothetical protein
MPDQTLQQSIDGAPNNPPPTKISWALWGRLYGMERDRLFALHPERGYTWACREAESNTFAEYYFDESDPE